MNFNFIKLFYILLFFIAPIFILNSQENKISDSSKKSHDILRDATISSEQKEIRILIRDVDISKFPFVKVIVEAFNVYGEPLDTLYADKLTLFENNQAKKIIKVEKISVTERVPVDFVFIIDITESMQPLVDGVKSNITKFTSSLMKRGIDYKIGLILFSDINDKVYDPTSDVGSFLKWLSNVKASGGGDVKENALEALAKASTLNFRPNANKVLVLITDAPFHKVGEHGDGKTSYNTESIINLLAQNELRVFSIVPPVIADYTMISNKTRGTTFDIAFPFSNILDVFSNQLTNLFALTYGTSQKTIPDSIDIALLNKTNESLIRKTIPIIELGRKLIIENLLYQTSSYDLPDSVKELEVLTDFMLSKQKVIIQVEGHTDNIGSDALNELLSLKRAESVKRYLIKKGINTNRIATVGYGERRPLASNKSDFGRKLNRRTEIVIIGK